MYQFPDELVSDAAAGAPVQERLAEFRERQPLGEQVERGDPVGLPITMLKEKDGGWRAREWSSLIVGVQPPES